MPKKGTPRLLGAVLEGIAKLEECKMFLSLKKITEIVEIGLRTNHKKVPKNLRDRVNKVVEFGVEQGILVKKNGSVRFMIGPRDIAIFDRKMGINGTARKKCTKKLCKGFSQRKPCKNPSNKSSMKNNKSAKGAKCKCNDNKKKRGKKKKKEECLNSDTDLNDEEEDAECELSETFSLASDLISDMSESGKLEDEILDWIHNEDLTDESSILKECQSDKIKKTSDTRIDSASATKTAKTNSKKSVNPLPNERDNDHTEDNSDEKMQLDEDEHELKDMNDHEDDEDDEDDYSSMEENLDQDMETDIGAMDSDPSSPICKHRYVQDYTHTNGKWAKDRLKKNKRTTQYSLGVIQGKVSKPYHQNKKGEKSRLRIREPATDAELLGADPDPLNHPLILDYYRNGRFKNALNPTAVTSKKSVEKKGNGSKCELI